MMDLPVRPQRRTLAEMDEQEIKKRYWSIGEVAEMFRTRTSHLRFLEGFFEMEVRRHGGGQKKDRLYDADDVELLRQIIKATGGRDEKLSLKAAYQLYLIGKLTAFNEWWDMNVGK